VKPAARGNEDIAADFQVIGKVDGHVASYLKISSAAPKRRPQQEAA
jgi:hypothetical protein